MTRFCDQQAPRKQRHTAHRIWERIGQEQAEVTVAESTVRHYVGRRKQELGMAERETFVPQSYDWGSEAQVDWYEAFAEVLGTQRKVYCFSMRSMAGGGAFHRAYYHATQQAFLEAHEFAFCYFGGVFRRLRYDNLKSAVKRILRGHQREETERLIVFRSHWGFETEFCNPARGNEKGGVEGEVGYFRRNHLVPVPRVASLEELNLFLLAGCGANFVRLSEQAIKEQRSHIGYLEALLAMEAEERDRHAVQKRIRDAKLPRLKTLEEFDFNQARQIAAAKIRELADGGYIERAEPVVFMGECGTGKTHLATGLCIAACRQKRRARFTTAANLVNELVEARQQNAVKRVLTRWLRYDVIVLDEVGYVPLAEIGAEFLFQVIAERAERAALIVTTNLPFSEWTQVFPNPRLCKALLDRITDRAHIIETGTESYRFRRTLEVRQKKKAS